MRISESLDVDDSLIEERFARASGPGGQHVSKTESAVQLRFDMARSALPDPVKARLARLAGSRLTKDGVIVLHVEDERSRERNREIARDRLRVLIDKASKTPKPRKKSRPSLASIKRQKALKAQTSEKKSLRRKPGLD